MSVPNSVAPEQGNGSAGQPHVRHIPIFVEGRDEPLLNKSTETTATRDPHNSASGSNLHASMQHQSRSSPGPSLDGFTQTPGGAQSSLFNRVKNFPVRSGTATGFDNDFFQGHPQPRYASPSTFGNNQRANSPASRTVPANVSPQPQQRPTPVPQSTTAATAESSIGKIQSIQRDVLALMDLVEQFTGTSKRDKQYLYLDEMLTQNLLKLDTIDTEGKENIKQARREAIKCINICIAALERKTEAAAASAGGQ